MLMRPWFVVMIAFATITGGVSLAGLTSVASAEGLQVDPPLPGHNAPVVPLIPYPNKLSLQDNATTEKSPDPSLTTLAPATNNSNGLDEVEIVTRKTVVLSSQSTWEKGFENLAASFKQLDEIVMAAGFDVKGRPFAVFTQTDDVGFRYDAMLPISSEDVDANANEVLQQAAAEYATGNEIKKPLPAVRLGESPSGKAFRFVHASPYDDIDTAYEAIATYLDSKNIVVNDTFIEEYVTDLTNPTDESLEVYIYVQQKDASQGAPQATSPDVPDSKLNAVPKNVTEENGPSLVEKPLESMSPQAPSESEPLQSKE